jgi:hypothetical protein
MANFTAAVVFVPSASFSNKIAKKYRVNVYIFIRADCGGGTLSRTGKPIMKTVLLLLDGRIIIKRDE